MYNIKILIYDLLIESDYLPFVAVIFVVVFQGDIRVILFHIQSDSLSYSVSVHQGWHIFNTKNYKLSAETFTCSLT